MDRDDDGGLLRMTVREAEAAAAQLLDSSWWPSNDLPVDPRKLAAELGIFVQEVPLRADESGNIVISPDETPVISLNKFDSESRRRFTCAHEIGHYLKRSSEPITERFVDFRDTLAGLGNEAREVFANQFAAALLMPAAWVAEFHRSGMSVADMARRFRTSDQAMEIRLRNLRLRLQ